MFVNSQKNTTLLRLLGVDHTEDIASALQRNQLKFIEAVAAIQNGGTHFLDDFAHKTKPFHM